MAAIVGILASLVGPAIEIGKCIAEPIKRQFNYLCCFNSTVQNLRDEAKRLEDARVGLQMEVTAAENNAEVIDPRVENWLKDVNEIQVKMNGIESEITNTQSGFLTVKSRFSLSKKAKKTSEFLKELRGNCKFDPLSHPAPPAATVPIPLGSTLEFESRKHIEEDIMSTLRDEKVNMIGISGMGGVGKTTMAKRIKERVMEEHLFDETPMAVVSQEVNKLKIQLEIAEQLGLKLEAETLPARAHKLRTRLACGKRILMVIDDVWENLKLEDLGIPCENRLKGCTILLTSRHMDVFNKMDVQKIYEIKTLAENEAWSLFQEKVGTYMDDRNLLSIAQEVVEECKGLPIALVTVGVALRNKRKSVWEDALEQLRSSNPTNLLDVLPEVYKPLKLSYDYLEDEQARSIFLLCSLFPEDHDIPIKDLTCYALGLSMFGNIGNLQLARNRTDSLVEMLTSRFLLLEGSDEYHVTMHDVVRDVSIFIASKESLINCEKCTWISPYLKEGVQLSSGSIFLNLRLLLIDKSVDEKFQMNDNFFEGMTKLNVLSVTDNSWRSSLRLLPHSTQLLKNLRTLILYSCKSLDTISVVGELVNLEILICRYCHSIMELPVEMRRLNCLRLLDLSYCEKLKTIAPGIISTLVGLEELKMVESFKKWEAEDNEGRERKNAGLRELESLSNLTCLEIEVEDFALAAEHIHLSSNRLKFDITIGDSHRTYLSRRWSENKMNLHLPREITVGNWILKFLGSVEHMTLVGEGLSNLELEQALQNLRSLTLGECSMVKRLGNIVFPLLEYLKLEKLDNLEEICDIDGPIPDDDGSTFNIIFKNLKELSLSSLPALKHLCKKDIGAKSHCGRHIKIFPKLEKLTLSDLPRLTTFCKGIESIKFPLLTIMSIWDCPKLMESHVCTTTSIGCGSNMKNSGGYSHDHDDEVDSLHLFCKPEEVAFGRVSWVLSTSTVTVWCRHIPITFFTGLEDLEMSQCNKIKSLFSSSIAGNLVNLKKLNIRFCWEMVKVIDEEEEKDACPQNTTCLFPSLEFLQLSWLYELEMFCGWRSCALELPSLKTVDIWQCPKIQRFSFASLTTPNLEEIRMPQMSWGGQGATFSVPKIIIKSKDLNDALQQIFFKVKKEEERERKIYEEMDKKAEEEEKEREEEQERKGDALQQVFKVKEEEERWTKIIEEEEEQERKGEIEEEDKHFSSTNSSAGGGENEERAEGAAQS